MIRVTCACDDGERRQLLFYGPDDNLTFGQIVDLRQQVTAAGAYALGPSPYGNQCVLASPDRQQLLDVRVTDSGEVKMAEVIRVCPEFMGKIAMTETISGVYDDDTHLWSFRRTSSLTRAGSLVFA